MKMPSPRTMRFGPWPSDATFALFVQARELHRAGLHDRARMVWFDACTWPRRNEANGSPV